MKYILIIKTNEEKAEIGLYELKNEIESIKWQAHLKLAESLHVKINELLRNHNLKLEDVSGLVVYKGPGSFTGIRIGITTANTLAYSLKIPIVGTTNEDWIISGINSLIKGINNKQVEPLYGSPAHTTYPKK